MRDYKAEDSQRPTLGQRGYDAVWQRLRAWYLDQHPICEIRTRCNGMPATEIDHIVSMTDGGARLDVNNLQATCRPCHNAKTRADTGRRKDQESKPLSASLAVRV